MTTDWVVASEVDDVVGSELSLVVVAVGSVLVRDVLSLRSSVVNLGSVVVPIVEDSAEEQFLRRKFMSVICQVPSRIQWSTDSAKGISVQGSIRLTICSFCEKI